MEEFSRTDQLKAILTPFCCCLRRRSRLRLSSPSSGEINQQYQQDSHSSLSGLRNPFYEEDGRSATRGSTNRTRTVSREEGRDGESVDDADTWSLHSGIGASPSNSGSSTRLRLRTRGGDISGGGASEGSGLTRWTLFKTWWSKGTRSGGQGAIRLSDEAEDIVDDLDRDTLEQEEGEGETTFTLEEGDAVPLELNDYAISAVGRTRSLTSSTHSDGTNTVGSFGEEPEDREARRARRNARRRARELGISIEEFEQGAAAGAPQELDGRETDSTYLQVETHRSKSRSTAKKGSRSSRTSSSSTSSRSQDQATSSTLPALHEDEVDRITISMSKERSRSRSKKGSSDGDSTRSRYDRRHLDQRAIDPQFVPLPISPRIEPGVQAHGAPVRSRHRSQPSTSTTSSSSTSRRSRKYTPASPLEDMLEASQATPIEYFEDANGQLRAEAHPDSAGFIGALAVDGASNQPCTSYDHIGLLPPLSPSS